MFGFWTRTMESYSVTVVTGCIPVRPPSVTWCFMGFLVICCGWSNCKTGLLSTNTKNDLRFGGAVHDKKTALLSTKNFLEAAVDHKTDLLGLQKFWRQWITWFFRAPYGKSGCTTCDDSPPCRLRGYKDFPIISCLGTRLPHHP